MVYVDAPKHRFGRMIMCHMLADTLPELFAMADNIGVARRHFQSKASTLHFDICKTKRKLAIQYGAKELLTRRETGKLLRKLRSTNPSTFHKGNYHGIT